MSFIPSKTTMSRLARNNFSLRAGDGINEDEVQLYERQALISDDNNDICDDEINSGQVRLRQQSDRERQREVGNGYELKNFNTRPYRDNNNESNSIEFTYYDIQANDSLQNICLRYACPISQVKRLNGLMTDQDFYGLSRLKLPLGKLALLDDLLKQRKNGSQDLMMLDGAVANQPKSRLVNSPGSALSVVNRHNITRFKPLLSPGYSSDRISDINRSFRNDSHDTRESIEFNNGHTSQMHNSRSFSSLRDFADGDASINISDSEPFYTTIGNKSKLPKHNFIKTEIAPDPSQMTIDNLLNDEKPIVSNVFEDLDYQVEQAKAAAENYDKRAADLVGGIESSASVGQTSFLAPRPSRIPELFFSGENFGLNTKRLVMLIFFVCLFIPLIYLSQAIRKEEHGSKTKI